MTQHICPTASETNKHKKCSFSFLFLLLSSSLLPSFLLSPLLSSPQQVFFLAIVACCRVRLCFSEELMFTYSRKRSKMMRKMTLSATCKEILGFIVFFFFFCYKTSSPSSSHNVMWTSRFIQQESVGLGGLTVEQLHDRWQCITPPHKDSTQETPNKHVICIICHDSCCK